MAVRHDPVEGREFCSGSLVAPRWVLTAAHCMIGAISVHFGVDAPRAADRVQVKAIHIHPKYDPNGYTFDFALLELEREAPARYRPISVLPTLPPDDRRMKVAGYGLNSPGILRTIELKITSFEKHAFLLANNLPERGVDHGDSGGPAFFYVDGRPRLFGVATAGNSSRVAYSRVDSATEWLSTVMRSPNRIRPRGPAIRPTPRKPRTAPTGGIRPLGH